MKLLLDAAGNVVVRNGKPVYVTDAGKEIEFDAVGTTQTIERLKGFETQVTELGGKLKKYDGIDDTFLTNARKAMDTVKNLDDKKLVDAGEVDRVKTEAIAAVEGKYKPVVEENGVLKGKLHKTIVGRAFAGSKFLTEKTILPTDFAEAKYGQFFKLNDKDEIVAYNASTGNPITSPARPGENATVEEALEFFINSDPNKDRILKGSNASGGGGNPGGGGGGSGNVMTRSQFNKLDPGQQAAKTAEMRAGKVQLVDG